MRTGKRENQLQNAEMTKAAARISRGSGGQFFPFYYPDPPPDPLIMKRM